VIVVDPHPGAPTVTAVSPKDKVTAIEPTSLVTISFSEPLDPATVTSSSVQVKDELGQVVVGALTYLSSVATFKPQVRLSLLGNYTVNVSTQVADEGHTPLAAPFSSSFTVRDGVWGKAEASLTASTSAFDLSSPLALASDGSGRAIAVWPQYTGTGTTLDVYEALFNEASGWAAPVKINTNAVRCQYPAVSMNASGDAIVGWIEYDATLGYSVQARRYVAGTWDVASFKVDLPTTSALTTYPNAPAVAITTKGDAHVVWYSYYYDSTSLVDYYGVYARHVDAKGAWDAAMSYLTYSQTGSGVSTPALAFDAAGNGFAAYQFSSGTPVKTDTIVERYVAATGKWGVSAVGASAEDAYAAPVSVATNPAGEGVVVWQRATTVSTTSTTYDVQASHFNKAWSAPVVISTATTYLQTYPALASSTWTGKSFLVTWSQSAGTPYDVYANEYKSSWGAATIVSDGNHTSFEPFLAGDGRGNALAVWYQQSDMASSGTVFPYDIVFARFTGATDKWSDPARVSSLFAGYRYPEVVVLRDGTALSAWQSTTHNGKFSAVNGVLENGFQ
jgi:hypothetical protein